MAIYLFSLSFFKYILLIMLLHLSQFFLPFIAPPFCTPLPSSIPPTHLVQCPWVIHISFLASPYPILFLIHPSLFCTYLLCFLFSVPFPTFSRSSSPLITLHVISISVIVRDLVVCLVRFCFRFSC